MHDHGDVPGDDHGHDHGHGPVGIERHCDVAIVGGGTAGLAAAGALARGGVAVIVVDAGGHDAEGHLAVEREEVRRHGGEVLAGRATAIEADDGRFRVELTGGHSIHARRFIDAADAAGTTHAVASSLALAASVASELADEDRRAGGAASANETDWDRRYGGEPIWSGNPNGSLVHEVTGIVPGRALDVGAGEGGDAVWLAEQGWQVTATDISQRGLDRVAAEARRRNLAIECVQADANAPGAFQDGAYDLVSAHYASIPRTPDDRGVRNLLSAVAPGGVLLVVGHDLAPMRTPVDIATTTRAFDPDAYVRVDDVVAALSASPAWEVEAHELRERPPGAASGHHVHDVVLRARRRP